MKQTDNSTPVKEETFCPNCLGRDGCMCALKSKHEQTKSWEDKMKKIQKNLEIYGGESCPICGITPKYYEAFISSLLSQQKQEMIKKFEDIIGDDEDVMKAANVFDVETTVDRGIRNEHRDKLRNKLKEI